MKFKLRFYLLLIPVFVLFASEHVLAQSGSSQDAPRQEVDAAVWGPFAQMVGHDWVSTISVSVRWTKVGEEMRASWSNEYGGPLFDMIIQIDSKPGRLKLTIPEGEYRDDYTGKLRDGVLHFKQKKLARAQHFHFQMIEPDVVKWEGLPDNGYEGQLAYRKAPSDTPPDRAVWGVYLDLIDRTWALNDRPEALGATYKFKWLIPGKVIAEIPYAAGGQVESKWVRHVRLGSNGKLLAVHPDAAYMFDAEGTVASDGSIYFKPLKKRMFSRDWRYRAEDNGRVSLLIEPPVGPKTPTFVAITAKEEKLLQDDYEAKRWAEVQRKRERLERFIDATNTMGGALSAAQREADTSAAQSRAELDATLARIQSTQRSSEPTLANTSTQLNSPAPSVSSVVASPTAAVERQRSSESARAQTNTQRNPPAHSDPAPQLQATPEAIIVCTKPDSAGRFECDTPINTNLRGGPNNGLEAWRTPESMIHARSDSCPGARSLPSATHLVWGCGFGATGNTTTMDRSAGVDVKGRQTFYCYPHEVGCRKSSP